MEKRGERNRAAVRRLWGFLGALWLVTACLAGCKVSGNDVGNGAGKAQAAGTVSSETGEAEAQSRGTENREAEEEDTESGKMQAGGMKDGKAEAETGEAESGKSEKTENGKIKAEEPESSKSETGENAAGGSQTSGETGGLIDEFGSYTSKDKVALYLHTYGRLPENYITKRDAEDLGWDSRKGNLWEVAPGMSIGGSRFGNYEGALPNKKGRTYFECDIDYEGGYRGAKRLIYSDDGLIFYTEDHYNTFEQLYGE